MVKCGFKLHPCLRQDRWTGFTGSRRSGKMVLAFKALKALSTRFKIFGRRKKAV